MWIVAVGLEDSGALCRFLALVQLVQHLRGGCLQAPQFFHQNRLGLLGTSVQKCVYPTGDMKKVSEVLELNASFICCWQSDEGVAKTLGLAKRDQAPTAPPPHVICVIKMPRSTLSHLT